MRRKQIHQSRTQTVIRLQPDFLKLASYFVHLVGIIALLDDRRDESGELGFLPAFFFGKLCVDEVETFECVLSSLG